MEALVRWLGPGPKRGVSEENSACSLEYYELRCIHTVHTLAPLAR